MIKLDPITFEVLKHRLWQINDEQGLTIRTISASPIVAEGNDFNVGLLTPEGELVVAGAYVSAHVTTMDVVLKNVIKEASEINDGDIFALNDPYRGCLHQNDFAMVSPFFHEGKLVLWVGNVLHHADVGGIDEGSFCVNATNIFHEPARFFLKIVDRGKLSPEVERTIMLNSRLPQTVALDLRAQIGAINVAKGRLKELIQERGEEVVSAVIHRSIDYAEERLREFFSDIPDGTWHSEIFMDGERVGSDRIHRICVKLDKKGSDLYFDYTGTAPQAEGAINATFSACYASTVVPIFDFICDGKIDWNGSIKRCVHVSAPKGTLVSAQFPAPVSICSIGMGWLVVTVATKAVAQMLTASGKYRDLVCPSYNASSNAVNVFGKGRRGQFVGVLLSDHRGAGAGARSFADGFDNCGHPFSYLGFMANVESQEWKVPILYQFRHQLIDSGGAGKHRGGLSVIVAFGPHKTEKILFKGINAAGTDQSNASGIDGGYPGGGSQVVQIRDVDTKQWLQKAGAPLEYLTLGQKMTYLTSKSDGEVGARDLLLFYPPGGGGYGDPLDRDPQRVKEDVLNRAVSREWAHKLYGVVLNERLEIDEAQTIQERQRIIEQRLSEAKGAIPVRKKPGGNVVRIVGEYLELVEIAGERVIRCRRCQHVYCSEGDNPQKYALNREQDLGSAGSWICRRWNGNSPNFVFVEYICPGCGVLIDTAERLKSDVGGDNHQRV